MSDTVGRFAWHCHHDMLLEILTEPYEVRVDYIERGKSQREVPTRLRLFKLVKGKLPNAVIVAGKQYVAALERWAAEDGVLSKEGRSQARVRRWHATGIDATARWKAIHDALAAHADEINALHAAECGCPWNGVTIFPE